MSAPRKWISWESHADIIRMLWWSLHDETSKETHQTLDSLMELSSWTYIWRSRPHLVRVSWRSRRCLVISYENLTEISWGFACLSWGGLMEASLIYIILCCARQQNTHSWYCTAVTKLSQEEVHETFMAFSFMREDLSFMRPPWGFMRDLMRHGWYSHIYALATFPPDVPHRILTKAVYA